MSDNAVSGPIAQVHPDTPTRSGDAPGRSISAEIDDLAEEIEKLAGMVATMADDDALRAPLVADAVRSARLDIVLAGAALTDTTAADTIGHGATLRLIGIAVRQLSQRSAREIVHAVRSRPPAVLIRVVITLAVSMSLVTFYSLTGWASYDKTGSSTLYVFGAVVGSVICTNALCFDAKRVWADMRAGQRLWRILAAKNLAVLVGVAIAATPVIVYLSATTDLYAPAMIDQFIVMVLIWLGVGNLLSVLAPLRHESLSARLKDGTWRQYLASFGVSYFVGITVNLMIYWRLWARQLASDEISAPTWTLQLLLFASGVLMWICMTVVAVSVAGLPTVRTALIREMLAAHPDHDDAGATAQSASVRVV
ncbi:hypothetical protein ACPXB3_08860 [Gordonia sp. DT219]|uniref:hypothetical protein n=1 Tax=Gordonia sp. DT219 TaxID=3416658 RepID=UPI003CF559AC